MKTQQKTQISFVSNKDLKERAMQKAKEDGITLKALFTTAMKLYVNNDLSFSLNDSSSSCISELRRDKELPNQYMIDSLREAQEDCKRGDVYSFNDPQKALEFIEQI